MSQQDGTQKTALQRPITNDEEAWKGYWKLQGQPWRSQPEIEIERQKYLAEHRNSIPDIEQGIYPFKGIKLNRADVEWLLATHENGGGPIFLRQEGQYKRNGPDLRGANLNKVNLSRLPLARILGGLSWDDWIPATQEQREMAGIHLNEADLSRAHLERCALSGAFFNVITNLKDIHMSSEK